MEKKLDTILGKLEYSGDSATVNGPIQELDIILSGPYEGDKKK